MRVSSVNCSSDRRAVAAAVEAQLGECELAVVFVGPRAAQERPQSRLQLFDVERLEQVVVGAGVEAGDAV